MTGKTTLYKQKIVICHTKIILSIFFLGFFVTAVSAQIISDNGYDDVSPEGSILEVNKLSTSDMKIYPNPIVNNHIHIHTSGSFLINEIRIYNILGKEVFIKNVQSSEKEISLKPKLSKGMYIIKVNTAERGSMSKKIIIK